MTFALEVRSGDDPPVRETHADVASAVAAARAYRRIGRRVLLIENDAGRERLVMTFGAGESDQ